MKSRIKISEFEIFLSGQYVFSHIEMFINICTHQ